LFTPKNLHVAVPGRNRTLFRHHRKWVNATDRRV